MHGVSVWDQGSPVDHPGKHALGVSHAIPSGHDLEGIGALRLGGADSALRSRSQPSAGSGELACAARADRMMHEGELPIDVALVRQLLAEQFPGRGRSRIEEVRSTGTVNAIYRVGDDACARLPRLAAWEAGLQREARWLPWLAERLSLRVPKPLGQGRAHARYPLGWALYEWIDGEPYTDEGVIDERQAARDLARFVRELRRLERRTVQQVLLDVAGRG